MERDRLMGLILEQETYTILGACFEVYKDKECGFLEAVYHECLEIKAVSKLADDHRAQVHNKLKATGHKVVSLVNFSHYPKGEHESIIR